MVLALLRKKGVGREENDMEGKRGETGSLGGIYLSGSTELWSLR